MAIAEKHYLGLHRGIPREARDLETAMQVVPALTAVLESVATRATVARGA